MIELSEPKNADGTPDLVSVVVPLFNEQGCIQQLHSELVSVMETLDRAYELVFVNDGSIDGSGSALDALAEQDDHVVAVHFRRNFGQTAAIMAGIDQSEGEIIVVIDADLQNDPKDIPRLLEVLDEGHDVVSGWRRDRQDALVTRCLPSRLANWLISRISGVHLHDYGCSLKAYRRKALKGVCLYGEMHRFIPIYAHMRGGGVAEIPVNHRPRTIGTSKYGLLRIYKVVLDLIVVKFLMSYSVKPIYFFGGFGLLCLGLSAFPIGGALFFKLSSSPELHKDFVQTPLPTIAATLILAGFLGILQGLVAEVLMRTYYESQQRRPYVVDRITSAPPLVEPVNELDRLLELLSDAYSLKADARREPVTEKDAQCAAS